VRGTYKIGGTRIGIRTTSEAFGAWVDETLAAYRMKRPVYPNYSIVVGDPDQDDGRGTRRRKLNILYGGTSPVVRTLDLPTLGRVLLAELETAVLPRRDDGIYADLALISSDGVKALASSWIVPWVGELGRRVQRAGLALPTARWIRVEPETGEVTPTRSALDIPEDALDRLATFAPAGDGRPDRTAVEAPVKVDVVSIYAGGEALLEPVGRGITLHRLAASVINLPRLQGTALEGMRKLVAGAQCYRIGFGRKQQVLDVLTAALAGENGA
jgi:hypothetical protein